MSMSIYISTLGRGPAKQTTFRNISPKWREKTKLVITPEEERMFRGVAGLVENAEIAGLMSRHAFPSEDNLIVLPPEVKGLSACRQWILHNAPEDYIVFMDDDLSFYKAADRGPDVQPYDFNDMIDVMRCYLNSACPLVGVDPTGKPPYILYPGIIMRCYAVNREFFIENGIRFDDHRLLQDFSVNLQCADKGNAGVLIPDFYCLDDGPATAPDGGVSAYRSPAELCFTALDLATEHPKSLKRLKERCR